MADVLRSCSKTACRWPAAASLSYRYATRQVWLLDLASAPDPSLYDLCPHHADHLVVPRGWERVDDRTAQDVMVEPSASARAEEAARRRAAQSTPAPTAHGAVDEPVAAGGRSRYAALVEQLPRLAAEASAAHAAHAATAVTIRSAPADAAPRASAARPEPTTPHRPSRPTSAPPPAPVPSRELAPLPPTTWRAAPVGPGASSEEHGQPDQPGQGEDLPGQLAIDVDHLSDEGVVVPFDFASGARRRPRG